MLVLKLLVLPLLVLLILLLPLILLLLPLHFHRPLAVVTPVVTTIITLVVISLSGTYRSDDPDHGSCGVRCPVWNR